MPDDITGMPLKDVISSLAAAVVATSQHLDQANVDLRNLYLSSGNSGLARLVPARYTLDDVTIELAFVVTDAKPQEVIASPVSPHPLGFSLEQIKLNAGQNKLLNAFLIKAVKDDAILNLTNALNTQQQLQRTPGPLQTNLQNLIDSLTTQKNNVQLQKNNVDKNIVDAQASKSQFERELANLPPSKSVFS